VLEGGSLVAGTLFRFARIMGAERNEIGPEEFTRAAARACAPPKLLASSVKKAEEGGGKVNAAPDYERGGEKAQSRAFVPRAGRLRSQFLLPPPLRRDALSVPPGREANFFLPPTFIVVDDDGAFLDKPLAEQRRR